jgi:hypothetical protein
MSGMARRILVVGRDYFFYTRSILDSLAERSGAEVRFIPIEPPGTAYKLAKRAPSLAATWLDRYHRDAIAAQQAFAPDLVLFIQVHQIGDRLDWYRAAFPAASFRLYYWDSITTHDYRPWLDRFDVAFSFDPEDCARLPQLRFLPLFFVPELRRARSRLNPPHDLSFVGTAVSRRRYDELEAWRARARRQGLTLDAYLLVSPFFYLSEMLRGRRLRDVRFRAMSKADVLAHYTNAAAVLDLPNNSQSGLTMRTFETLGAHRKLVTANKRILAADFHDPGCISVLETGGDLPPREWLRDGRTVAPSFEAHSLESWVDRLLGRVSDGEATEAGPLPQTTKVTE